ncbi:DoxX family protein [Microvirga massiliensis]|uniref:DoxX family protein n=1 Tax=Microvirga massiliensis TaxID=1033741 RepID=UPI0007C7A413|nr:DoxX family protein [Microvirga massiliensis]
MIARTNDVALLVARLAVAALFLPAGIGKLFGLSGFAASLAGKGVPFPELLAALGVAAEIIGPVALVLGVVPRLTALLLIAFTVVATLIGHSFWAFPEAAQQTQQTQFFKNVAIIGGLLFYFVSGPGTYRVPARLLPRWGVPKAAGTRIARGRT